MTVTWPEIVSTALKVPGLLVEIYGDLARPGVRLVGKALESIIGLGNTVLWPITWANERSRIFLERNLELYRERLSATPEERVIPVVPEIGVPIAEKLAYVADDKLSDLYVNLLVTASSLDTVSHAHPIFVNIINNLSPDEAQLLEVFACGHSMDIPFLTAKLFHPTDRSFSVPGDLLISPELSTTLRFSENVPAYISNLCGLGIVEVVRAEHIADSTKYEELEAYWAPRFSVSDEPAGEPPRKLQFAKGIISITVFGRSFISACRVRREG